MPVPIGGYELKKVFFYYSDAGGKWEHCTATRPNEGHKDGCKGVSACSASHHTVGQGLRTY